MEGGYHISDLIYNDILHTFAYNEDGYYRFYMKDAPKGFLDLETLIQEKRGSDKPVFDVDLKYLYNFIVEEISLALLMYRSVNVCEYKKGDNRYFEVHWKNYKQTVE